MQIKKYKYKLFGRSKGRKNNQSTYDFVKKYAFNFENNSFPNNYNILDIGSGSGENALFLSNNIKNNIITCEIFHDGNINLCNKIEEKKINNIKLFQGNALEFIDTLNGKLTFDEIWILFPDPWPKKRHHKRRLINSEFLKKMSFSLKKNGHLFIASDSVSYNYSILNSIYDSRSSFQWKNQSFFEWNYAFLNLPLTKFYIKAEKSNRNSMFFKLIKI